MFCYLLLHENENETVIDFNSCRNSWYMYVCNFEKFGTYFTSLKMSFELTSSFK